MKGRVTVRGKDKDKSTQWLIPEMAVSSEAESGQSQRPGASVGCPMYVQGPKCFGHRPLLSQMHHQEAESNAELLGLGLLPIWHVCVAGSGLSCYIIIMAPYNSPY